MIAKKEVENNKRYNIWIISTLMLIIIIFSLIASITIYIDPLFHFHAPIEKFQYIINEERYQNDGISRNFNYDSIITGTSMAENFMKSEADEVFGADFIKVPFSGASYKEVNENLKRAYDGGKSIKYVIRSLDYSKLIQNKDAYREDIEYPTYLYNNNLFDDVNYVLNKDILFNKTLNVFNYTRGGKRTTSFDIYANWNKNYSFGKQVVLNTYSLGEKVDFSQDLTEEERITIIENIRQNVTNLADVHPETIFYYFFPPYSICYWDGLYNSGKTNWHIAAEQIAIEEILKHPNIKLFSFYNNTELICNLDNYKDQGHYGEWVNSWILGWMRNGKYLLTEDNYQEYLNFIKYFYNSYDYASLRE